MAEHTLRILLAEDNPGDVAILEHVLSGFRTEVRHVRSLEKLCEVGAVWDADVILLDLHLEDSQDFMVTTRTVVTEFPNVPIIALTSLDDKDYALRALQAGVSAYLIKGTLSGADLMHSMREAVARKKAQYMSVSPLVSSAELKAMIREAVDSALTEEAPPVSTSNRILVFAVLAVFALLGGAVWWGHSQLTEVRQDRQHRKKTKADVKTERFQEFQKLRNAHLDARMKWESNGSNGPKPQKPPRLLELEQELAQ